MLTQEQVLSHAHSNTHLYVVSLVHNDDGIGPVDAAELGTAGGVHKVVVGHEHDVSTASQVSGQEVGAHLVVQQDRRAVSDTSCSSVLHHGHAIHDGDIALLIHTPHSAN